MPKKNDLSELDKAHLKIHRLENIISKMGEIVQDCMKYTESVEKEHMPFKYNSSQTAHDDEIDPFISNII